MKQRKKSEIVDELGRRVRVGNQMSNVMFNLAQRKYDAFDEDEWMGWVGTFVTLYREWDLINHGENEEAEVPDVQASTQ